jgi:hypothetical protein
MTEHALLLDPCVTFQATVLLNLQLEPRENPVFHPTRQAFLGRLADAGNAHACYRLAMGCAYHPRSLHDRASPLEEAMRLLRRAISIGEESIRADAAYELWLLTRRLPNLADDPEDLLTLAIATGSIPARFAAHRSRNGVRRPVHFTISPEYHAAQEFLVAALDEVPFDPVRFSVSMRRTCRSGGFHQPAALGRRFFLGRSLENGKQAQTPRGNCSALCTGMLTFLAIASPPCDSAGLPQPRLRPMGRACPRGAPTFR